MASPKLVPPIVGNDTLTVDGVYTGADIEAANIAVNPAADLGGGFSTSGNVWMELAQPLTASEDIVVTETLWQRHGQVAAGKARHEAEPAGRARPDLPGPADVKVADTTLNATLVLLKNGAVVGYGGAEPGDATLDVVPQFAFADGDKVSVVQYIGPITSPGSNIVTVNCSPQNVVTQHNDNARQGAQLHETKLTPTTVTGPNFGLLYERHVIGTLLAQPLYVHGVNVKNEIRNVIYIATAEDVVYAFDADDTSPDTTTNVNGYDNSGNVVPLAESTKWLWRTSLGTPHVGDICGETVPPIVGITSAPVIDVSGGVMYVVARDQHDEHGMGHDYLHALDIETGHDLRNRQVGGTDPVHGFVFNDAVSASARHCCCRTAWSISVTGPIRATPVVRAPSRIEAGSSASARPTSRPPACSRTRRATPKAAWAYGRPATASPAAVTARSSIRPETTSTPASPCSAILSSSCTATERRCR